MISRFILNDREVEIDLSPGKTVLDLLRKDIGLFGTKEGCREGECGACSVILGRMPLVPYRSVPSCMLSSGQLTGTHLVTVEGLDIGKPNRLQQAFIDEGGSQCGYCTPGFIVSLSGYLMSGHEISVQGAIDSLDGNICRCTGYASIRRAVEFTIGPLLGKTPSMQDLIELELLPPYFAEIPQRLESLVSELEASPTPVAAGSSSATPGKQPAFLVAGGTELYVRQGEEVSRSEPEFLIPESEEIQTSQEFITIPGTASMEQLRIDPALNRQFPGLDRKIISWASYILRNRATIAGNLVNASPIADSAVLLLGWDARVVLKESSGSTRTVPLRKFYQGYKTLDMKRDERLESVLVPVQLPGSTWHFSKVSKRERLDIASCNSASLFLHENSLIQDLWLGFGGVAPIPLSAEKTMDYLRGKQLSVEIFLEAVSILKSEISPIDDVRGTAEYKRSLAAAQLAEHFLEAFPDHVSYADFLKGGVL